MLVRDLADGYQIVLQPDHGDFAGALAAAWSPDERLSVAMQRALVLAATRHDDGWAGWERRPRLDPEGRPQQFSAVPVASILSSYRASVDLAVAVDPLAGLLVSMHVSGLRRGRYGVLASQETVPIEEIGAPVAAFVRDEEARQAVLAAEYGVDEAARRRAYALLQVFDIVALHAGLADLERDGTTIALAGEEPLCLEPTGSAWEIACRPYPFAAEPVRIPLVRRVIPGRAWTDELAFQAAFAAAPPEAVEVVFTDS